MSSSVDEASEEIEGSGKRSPRMTAKEKVFFLWRVESLERTVENWPLGLPATML